MFYLKKISTTALMVTTLMGSGIHFACAMHTDATQHTEETQKHTKVPFSGIRVTSADGGLSLLVSVEEEPGSGRFRLVESSDEAEKLITTLTTAYNELPESAKLVKPPAIKIRQYHAGQIGVKEEQKQEPVYRYIGDENVNETLQTMLAICTEAYKKEEERRAAARQAAERAEQERLVAAETLRQQDETIRIQAETLKMQQDITAAKALLAKRQQEQAAEVLKQQQEEYAALQTQLIAQQTELTRQQEESRAAQQAQQAQLAAQQAEFARQQEADAAAAAAQQQQRLLGGRTPDRAAHNCNKEVERGAQGIINLASGKPWKFGRKKQ